MIEYITFVEEQAKNREELAKGVKGVTCTYVGTFGHSLIIFDLRQELTSWLEYGQYIGTVEVYQNGRVNAYVREEGNPIAIGFLRISPNLDFLK